MATPAYPAMWADAMARYEHLTKKSLIDIPKPLSSTDLIKQVGASNTQYEAFRARQATLYKVLTVLAAPLDTIGNMVSGATQQAFPPASMVFGAVSYLIGAAKGVTSLLDAIADLLRELQNFTTRLRVYDRSDLSRDLREKLTETLVVVIEILAISTKKVKDPYFRAKAYAKNVLLGNDTEMKSLLAKLDRLTKSEDSLVGAETLVEVKSTNKGVQAIQNSMSTMQMTAQESSQDIAEIKAILEETKTQEGEHKKTNRLELIAKVLKPSSSALDKFEQVKRERRLIPTSGDWIVSEESFVSWLGGNDRPLLWISGMPGSGKSFLTYNIVTRLQDRSETAVPFIPKSASVAYFFFQDNSETTQSYGQAFRDLAYQLVRTDAVYLEYLATVLPTTANLDSIDLAWKILFEDYWVNGNAANNVYLVLDGMDESLPQERATFFDLLQMVDDLGSESKLRVVMLGRPQIVQEMSLVGLREPPTVYVDATKNGADITQYVRSSISRSQALKRISVKLKNKIIETLTQNAGGMFMWAKLMLDELKRKAQRGRESEVEKALSAAPKDLTDMITHVLEGFSTTLEPEEADDLNDMLMWVALAQRPLKLAELDAALRIKTEDGTGLVFLEGMLRKAYASFFTLTRDDGLTTPDLLGRKQIQPWDDVDEEHTQETNGEEDLDFPAEMNSNPETTTVAFSHASISDYFLDVKHGKVTAPKHAMSTVGIELMPARYTTAEICTRCIIDETFRSSMQDPISLKSYALANWRDHVAELNSDLITKEQREALQSRLRQMLYNTEIMKIWIPTVNAMFFTAQNANIFWTWCKDDADAAKNDDEVTKWIDSISSDRAIDIFERCIRFVGGEWVGHNVTAAVIPSANIVNSWLLRRNGQVIDSDYKLDDKGIKNALEWLAIEGDSEYYRKLGMTYRELELYDDARFHFERALELDPTAWLSRSGLSQMYYKQKKYQLSLDTDTPLLALFEENPKQAEESAWLVNVVLKRMADCYKGLREAIIRLPSDSALGIERNACEYFHQAFQAQPMEDLASASQCLQYWRKWARYGLPYISAPEYTNLDEVPPRQHCLETIMSIAGEMEKAFADAPDKHWLWAATQFDQNCEDTLAEAAEALDRIPWLIDQYKEAGILARKELKPVTAAAMVLSMASLYHEYADDGETAMKLWDTLVSSDALSPLAETGIKWTQGKALLHMSNYCIRKSLEDPERSDQYIGKIENIWSRGTSTGEQPPSLVAFSLSAWYSKLGRHEGKSTGHDLVYGLLDADDHLDAYRMSRPNAKAGIELLSDDDPSNDLEGWTYLGLALAAVRDDENTIAFAHRLRRFKNGISMLTGDPPEADDSDATYTGTDFYNSDSVCDGPCNSRLRNLDDMVVCRAEGVSFCQDCYALLLREGQVHGSKCRPTHEVLYVPALTCRFKENEMVVNGKVIEFETWRQTLKDKWSL